MNDTASLWSAIAATFSAIAAITIMIIQRKNLLESSKPEIVLEDWERYEVNQIVYDRDVFSFNTIFNAGKGSALHIHINANDQDIKKDSAPRITMSTKQASIVPANKEIELKSEITLNWENAKLIGTDKKFIPFEIKIYCWCSSGYRHETIYTFMAFENNNLIGLGGNEVAPKITLCSRRTISHSVMKLKTLRFLSKAPKIGKFISIKE